MAQIFGERENPVTIDNKPIQNPHLATQIALVGEERLNQATRLCTEPDPNTVATLDEEYYRDLLDLGDSVNAELKAQDSTADDDDGPRTLPWNPKIKSPEFNGVARALLNKNLNPVPDTPKGLQTIIGGLQTEPFKNLEPALYSIQNIQTWRALSRLSDNLNIMIHQQSDLSDARKMTMLVLTRIPEVAKATSGATVPERILAAYAICTAVAESAVALLYSQSILKGDDKIQAGWVASLQRDLWNEIIMQFGREGVEFEAEIFARAAIAKHKKTRGTSDYPFSDDVQIGLDRWLA